MKSKKVVYILVIILCLGMGLYLLRRKIFVSFFSPRSSNVQEGVSRRDVVEKTPTPGEVNLPDIEVIAENLNIPWEIAFLPNGDMLVTERPGTLLKIAGEKHVIKEIEGVRHVGEGGLLGLVVDPDFENNHFIYLYLTTQDASGLTNRLERYRLEGDSLSGREVVLEGIKGASNHDGGRIKFGPDNKLYVTTGDAQTPSLAQDTSSLNGKILRINPDGSIPEDNPFGNAVYSYGHRNPQGLAWDTGGRLWAIEHGPSGTQTGNDELNLIEKGKNYGWPEIRGKQEKEGMVTPVIESGRNDTWAPSGAVFWDGSVFFAGLRGESLYEANLKITSVHEFLAHFQQEFGRLRTVVLGPEGYFYITTSNRDGRGKISEGDDKIIRVNPEIFRLE